ncbi:MAG: flagellar hook-associated protein 3 FlgL [Candidatus Azotimanducaceae bacterium]|jgi:flagellar hook-associated protein 3 FlgL
MRLSTNQIYQQGINVILDQQSKLAETNQKIGSGKNLLRPSDDPAAAVKVLSLTSEAGNIEQFSRNIDTARTQLSQGEQAMSQAGNVIQRSRELIVQANNDALSPSDRGAIAIELASLQQEMLSLANSKDESGNYYFSGFQSDTAPFQRTSDGIAYEGDQGTRMLQIGSGIQVETRPNGQAVFGDVRSGNGTFSVSANDANTGNTTVQSSISGSFVPNNFELTFTQSTLSDPITFQVVDGLGAVVAGGNYVEGEVITFGGVNLTFAGTPEPGDRFSVSPSINESVFDVLSVGIDALNAYSQNGLNSGLLHNKMDQVLDGLDQSLSHLLDERASIGARLNSLDSQQEVHDKNLISYKAALSDIQDLDYAEAINELNLRLTSLQAAQQAYIKIQDLSLFRYLN